MDTSLLGDFDGFLDFLFGETHPDDQTRYMGDAAAELSGWACFVNDTPHKPTISEIMSWKVGRNDPCPCGSGKKFKKCCLRRLEEWELKMERDPGLERDTYPPVIRKGGRPGLSDFYSQDAIAVDRLAYRTLKLLKGPLFRQRAEERQAKKRAKELLLEAFQETRRICDEHGLKTSEEFDSEYRVHYDCAEWLEPLLEACVVQNPTYNRDTLCFNQNPIPVLLIMTSNAPDTAYLELLRGYQQTLTRFVGSTTLLVSGDTLHLNDYSKLDWEWSHFDPEAKKLRHETVFPQERRRAFDMGVALIKNVVI